jgi:hypothetical protein
MKAYIAIPTGKKAWDQEAQVEIEADSREILVAVAKTLSALNKNRTVRLSWSKGYDNQGSYITNDEIKITNP